MNFKSVYLTIKIDGRLSYNNVTIKRFRNDAVTQNETYEYVKLCIGELISYKLFQT